MLGRLPALGEFDGLVKRFVWPMVMPQQARRTMVELRRALDQSRRLYVNGRTTIAS